MHRSVPDGFTAQHVRCPRGVSRLHAPEIYSRSSSGGGLGTDRGCHEGDLRGGTSVHFG